MAKTINPVLSWLLPGNGLTKQAYTIAINTTGPYGAAAVEIILVVPQNGMLHTYIMMKSLH